MEVVEERVSLVKRVTHSASPGELDLNPKQIVLETLKKAGRGERS